MKIINKMSDFFFALLNYLTILLIIALLVFVIRWRLHHMFTSNIQQSEKEITIIDELNKNKEEVSKLTEKEKEENNIEVKEAPVEFNSIVIPENPNSEIVADILLEKGLIQDKTTFVQQTKNLGVSEFFIPGTFNIPKDYKVADIINMLTEEKKKALTQEVYITIPENATSEQMAEILLSVNLIQDKVTFVNMVKNMELEGKFIPGRHIITTPIKVADMIKILCGQN